MASDGVVDEARRMRAVSVDAEDDVVISEKPILRLSSPSPIRAAGHALEAPPVRRRTRRRSRPVRMFRAMCRSFPVLTPRCGGQLQPGACRIASPARLSPSDSLLSQLITSSSGVGTSRRQMTGTLFGYRQGRIALSLQENPRCLPTLVVELPLPTHAMLRELSTTACARIVLESEKHAADGDVEDGGACRRREENGWVLEEPIWTMFCNGKRVGYAVRRDPTDDDIAVLETLWAVSMVGGVLPCMSSHMHRSDGEMAYMRGCFEYVFGSRDSKSLYMMGPHGGDCPELAVFFVRL
ncbi:hypothetical protein GUJ93_ZPchr0458g22534 [Zizania palustris]|uniref:Uncharacterized protein n=1 Tax=Zizania palustris TaxID=103762 RepID=A0A8J5R761_ZIZPA|nr:hypothetical protein GUJ93_ZPchr0458g22534 [Zizania palustris]